jgi:translation initiation factor 1
VVQGDGIVRVRREKKGRRGKTVTVVTGLALDAKGLQRLARQLKRRCGAGGTVKDDAIEIQGDHWDVLAEELGRQGHSVKRSGG